MLLFVSITLLIILNIYYIFKLYLINDDSELILCKNMDELKLSLFKSNPSLINIPKDNIDLDIFKNLNPTYKNIELFNTSNLKSKINFSELLLNSNLYCNFKYSLSYFNDKKVIDFKECKNNYHIISNIDSKEFYIYLLHPKHKNSSEKLNLSNKVLIKPHDILIIPFGWNYLQEINDKTINYHIDIDNYFTFIHNSILNKI